MTTTNSLETLFSEACIGSLWLRNRVVMAPMTRRFADENRVPTDGMRAYYARRARLGVGLIITEGTVIDPVHAPPRPKNGPKDGAPGAPCSGCRAGRGTRS